MTMTQGEGVCVFGCVCVGECGGVGGSLKFS